MPIPQQLAPLSGPQSLTIGGGYDIQGELVPVLTVELAGMTVYFEHHVLLWKDPQVEIGIRSLKGGFKRIMAGMPIFLTEAKGRGRIAFSRDGTGQLLPIHITPAHPIEVREHQFLAATGNVDYTFTRVRGVANLLFSGTGFFIDRFSVPAGEGVVWLHGYGNVFEVELGPGEQIDVEPGGWVYKDAGMRMETIFQRFSTGFFASGGQIFWNRFTGPGRMGIQSMYQHMPTDE